MKIEAAPFLVTVRSSQLYFDSCLPVIPVCQSRNINIEKLKPLKKPKTTKLKNAAGSVWLSLFMDGIGKCKLPFTPPSTGLNRIDYCAFWNLKHRQMYSYSGYHGIFNVTQVSFQDKLQTSSFHLDIPKYDNGQCQKCKVNYSILEFRHGKGWFSPRIIELTL